MLDVQDFGPNPHVPAYGDFGAVTVRWAKGTTGSGPRRRTVLTVPEFDWVVDLLRFWITERGRAHFATADRSAAPWPSERAERIRVGSLSDAFAAAREAGEARWDMVIRTDRGDLTLSKCGAVVSAAGLDISKTGGALPDEYRRIYERFADLVALRRSDVDAAPLQLTADAFLAARWAMADPFEW